MTLQKGILCLALLGLSTGLICPNGDTCEDRNTCCPNPAGAYGCCPLPNLKEGVKAVICPDQESECPDDTTCCQLPDSSWGCCPLAKAVCCEDKRHCCPEGTTCDLTHSKCLSAALEAFPMLDKLPARRRDKKSVTCPGGKSSCPEETTCCLLTSGDYGCCPFPKAVCCSDQLHCCPGNTTCDLEHEMCKSGETQVPLSKKIPALPNDGETQVPLSKKIPALPNDVNCPDKMSTCPDQTTCCQMANGTYGCCPMPDAVCCSDHIHCCPSGTECDLVHSTCMSAQGQTTMAMKIPAAVTTPTVQNAVHSVPCNDSLACAEGKTCCKSALGEWACCPLPKAVCCEDHLHCCPHGTVCNQAASTCDDRSGNAMMPWISKVPAFTVLTENVQCDTSTSCPGNASCCKTPTGDWACCPLPEAVCCDDYIHCCPHDTVCNLEAETCDDPSGSGPSLPWVEKVSTLTTEGHDEKCDRQTMCPGGTTCCKQNSGHWACCPLPQAVCCNDHEHCCPKGYKCNVIQQTCDKPGDLSLPWVQKIPARQEEPAQAVASSPRPAQNMCDARTSCPKDTTCCFMNQAGKWGCCPLPKAVCCTEGDHCCPSGYICDAQRSSCSKGHHAIPWYSKLSALTQPGTVADVKCDDKSSCASGTTCCKLPTGEWGCCPLVKAVCCEDLEHCCPQGYTCNMQTGTCEKKARQLFVHTLPVSRVVESKQRDTEEEEEGDVPCDRTGEFHCPKRDTCCKTSATEWACCPSPKAVCCADWKHCCPAGYSCDLAAAGCTQPTQPIWDTSFWDKNRNFVPLGL